MGPLPRSKTPCGFRFYPTDEELFMCYLTRKVLGKKLDSVMSELDVYRFAPWDLPAKACLKTRDQCWFFLCPKEKKYPSGGRANRATGFGYWKSTGNDRTFQYKNRLVGKIKTLIFHRGKAPKGDRTDWVMHEYRLEDRKLADQGVPLDSYVLCKVYEKSGWGPKNGEHYGAPYLEEEWDTDDDDADIMEDSGVVLDPTVGTRSCALAPALDTLPLPVAITNIDTLSPTVGTLSCALAPTFDTLLPPAAISSVDALSSNLTPSEPEKPHTLVVVGSCEPVALTGSSEPHPPVMMGSSEPAALIGSSESLPLPDDDIDTMLAAFTEEDRYVCDDFFEGLDDLPGGSDFTWSQLLSDDGFLELTDFGSQFTSHGSV